MTERNRADLQTTRLLMQPRSFDERIDERLHIYPSPKADALKRQLLARTHRPYDAMQLIESIGQDLLARIAADRAGAAGFTGSSPAVVPIIVLRGGLALWRSCMNVFGMAGIIVPARARPDAPPEVVYCSVPVAENATYALVDVLVASGRTITACLVALEKIEVVEVIAPFVAASGRRTLISQFPDMHVRCIWHDEQIDDAGRMVGPGFDIGDFTLGHAGPFSRAT